MAAIQRFALDFLNILKRLAETFRGIRSDLDSTIQSPIAHTFRTNESVEELMCRAYAPRDCEGEPDARNAERDGETVRSANGDL